MRRRGRQSAPHRCRSVIGSRLGVEKKTKQQAAYGSRIARLGLISPPNLTGEMWADLATLRVNGSVEQKEKAV